MVKAGGQRSLVKILYEDSQYVVFDKPAGLLVIPTPKNEQRTLVNLVNQELLPEEGSPKLHPCHRIDRDTSGAIIFSKGKRHQKLMMDMFRRREIKKKYIAFVHGTMPSQRGEFHKSIKDFHQQKYQKRQPAVEAITAYKVLLNKARFSVVEVRPVTGRTNQIRIHFAQAGHPLVGERKYAFAKDFPLKFRRTALHAASLEWEHPVTHQNIRVQSELAKDMKDFMANN